VRKETRRARQTLTSRVSARYSGRGQLSQGVTRKSVLTMSFIIGPLSGALVAGGVWPLIAYHLCAQ
jgi:hypothetical protein